ncbi:phosphatidylinositol N-acetylglucosaminyltransferase GPI15 KNAG_0H02070 [Huiozyma naganishii CBS 8797]|uniref:Phosphatidylinositol N-acetylglucosaminyltransferase subunit H conserved domain-containing protein n=1 Tax=Huiozyma naganishii (strain ATCC MYA-139 / BCRC 22969 / CBS 8797 / KCTC 17520 / NBRC 10181 / NCYC 3082 / Yp74L-3) TaxID=1071383 RepID=J7S9P3_HUIN7|nr:hypothetical protein KNAG_0H02070 [Kazachstania naganishii CBS 8797]CCK71621.1 hypothetical protein KNAG_0H02070 [Kazachstania naganishii CBS 8797]
MDKPCPEIRRIERENYYLYLEKNDIYACIKVGPRSYWKSILFNGLLLLLLNYGVHHLLLSQKITTGTRWIWLLTLIGSLTLIQNPAIESITVFQNNGVQLSTVRGYIFLPHWLNERLFSSTEFITQDKIVDLVINEGFYAWFQVMCYLCIIIRGSDKLKRVFLKYKILLEDQKTIYNVCRECLYSAKDKEKMSLSSKVRAYLNE